MPFTLAHPAAVLPLKRYCPRWLNFTGLVVGSLTPDAGYIFARWQVDELSHRFVGTFVFDLPAGILMLVCLYQFRDAALQLLPGRLRPLLLPERWQPPAPPFVMLVSVLLGIWTHLFWDSFTHTHGFLVERSEILQYPLLDFRDHTLELCHVLWYVSSFAGVAGISWYYERRLNPSHTKGCWRNALLIGLLVLPIEALHHLVPGIVGVGLVGGCSLLLTGGMAFKMRADVSPVS